MAKFDPFLSLDCTPTPSTLAQSKEKKGSNFAIWQPCSLEDVERRELGALSNEELRCSSGAKGADRGAANAAVIAVAVICSVLSLGLMAYTCYYFKHHPTARDPITDRTHYCTRVFIHDQSGQRGDNTLGNDIA